MINISDRRECFFDSFLINEEKTTAERRLNKPTRRGVILELNMPWEGKYATFFSTFYAEGRWRMYYATTLSSKEKYICYAESEDGAISRLSGKPVSLTVKMYDADLYSIKFN